MRKLGLLACLCLVPLTHSCLAVAGLTVGAAGAVGYVYYDKNEAHRDFDATFDKTWKAALAALQELKYTLPAEREHAADSGVLTLDDLKVHVARHPGDMTRVSVRVGTFDSEEHRRRAGLILEKIAGEL